MPVKESYDDCIKSAGSIKRHQLTQRSTWVSVVVNCLLSTGQIITGFISASQGLVAEGVHSLSDLVADGVVLFASHHGRKQPDKDHHYGHLRYENAAALILGIILCLVGLGIIVSASNKLFYPQTVQVVHEAALWAALISVAAKELLFRYMMKIGRRLSSSLLIANAWHARSDAISSLIVLVGVAGNLMGWKLLDSIGALVVGTIIIRAGWNFGSRALHDLTDRAITSELIEAMRTTLLNTEGVRGLHALRTRKMSDFIILDVHLEVDGHITVIQGHGIATLAKDRMIAAYPEILDVMIHIDPV